MNLEEFLNGFKDVIPFGFNLKIGGPKACAIKTNKELISSRNRKGKCFTYYKDNVGQSVSYRPIDEVVLPIELTIQCQHPHAVLEENLPKTINKIPQQILVRVLSEDRSRQIGCLILDLTAAGDISRKFQSFYNEDGTRHITQRINYKYDDHSKKVVPLESVSYSFSDLETGIEEKVEFYKEDGVLKGLTISKQKLKNPGFESIIFSEEQVDEKCELFARYCNNATVEERHITPLVCDMTNYIINKDFGGKHWVRFDHETGKPTEFYGEYIGNTIIKSGSQTTLIIETLKDEYHYFTSVDITGTHAFDVDFYHYRYDSSLYENALRKADKTPMFRVKIVDGEEVLVPLGEQITDAEIKNFEMFKSYCTESFGTIENKKMAAVSLNRASKSESSQQLLKRTKDNQPKK